MAHSPDFDDTDMNKLTSKIFSILENNFLFGHGPAANNGKVRILSIDADVILAAKSLCLLETSLRQKSGNPDSRIADYFDLAAGGVLAALLFARGPDGRPLSTAEDALQFLLSSTKRKTTSSALGRILTCSSGNKSYKAALKKKFGELSLKDTLKAVLVPCYDLTTRAPFVFSRADAIESDAFDFKLSHVCSATTADHHPHRVRCVDNKTKIVLLSGGLAVGNNPTAVAITHVLNNKQEFPLCQGVDDLLVLSLAGGGQQLMSSPSAATFASLGTSDLVDEAVSMAFGERRSTNYARIQGNSALFPSRGNSVEIVSSVEDMLRQKNAESMLFRGKKLVHKTNAEKLDLFAGELIKEHQRRQSDTLPTVLLKHAYVPPPRTSSATSTFPSTLVTKTWVV